MPDYCIVKRWPCERGGRVELEQDGGTATVWYFRSADDGEGMGYEPGMLPIELVCDLGASFAELCVYLFKLGCAAAIYQPADVRRNAVRAQRYDMDGWR